MSFGPRYESPGTLAEALDLIGSLRERAVPLAGGTDVAVRLRRGDLRPDVLVDLRGVGLDGVAERNGSVSLGAMVRIADLAESRVVASRTPLLLEAVAEFGSPQIRSQATVGGNLANASPVGDLAPALVALDASVRLASVSGDRLVRLEEFPAAPGRTVRRPDELVAEVLVPFQRGPGAYERLVYRRSLAIAVASVVVHVEMGDGAVVWARVAAGAVAPRAVSCPRTALALVGGRSASGVCDRAAEALATETSPISDPRASRAYRAGALAELLRSALGRCLR